ncbi:MAG: hypothetical protein ABIH41_06590 [Nanoarchaeota archaeon]
MAEDYVMDDESMARYAAQRVFDPSNADVAFRMRRLVVHNAHLLGEVADEVMGKGDATLFYPPKSTEPHLWVPSSGELHVVNARDPIRLVREENLAWALNRTVRKDDPIDFAVHHYRDDAALARFRFGHFAEALARNVMACMDHGAVSKKGRLDVLLGPYDALDVGDVDAVVPIHSGIDSLFPMKNEFLNYRIIDDHLINLDYAFASQLKNVLDRLYVAIAAYFPGADVNVFHYGKVGVLRDDVTDAHACVPRYALDANKIADGRLRRSEIPNELVSPGDAAEAFAALVGGPVYVGTTVNTTSVLKQTRSQLLEYLACGGDFMDMEWSPMSSLDHGYNSAYEGLGTLRYFLAGARSDAPLSGTNLGNTDYHRGLEFRIANAFRGMIREGV